MDACELELKVTMEAFIKKYGERKQPGRRGSRWQVAPKKIAELNSYSDKLLKQISEKRKQIDLFPHERSGAGGRDAQPERALLKSQRRLFDLRRLESEPVFCQLDYDEWLRSKLKGIPRAQTIQAGYLFDCQLRIFMEQDG